MQSAGDPETVPESGAGGRSATSVAPDLNARTRHLLCDLSYLIESMVKIHLVRMGTKAVCARRSKYRISIDC